MSAQNETTRGHVSKLFVRQSRVDVRKYFLETVLLKFGIVCQQQWKTLQAYESLNPLSSVLTCLSM